MIGVVPDLLPSLPSLTILHDLKKVPITFTDLNVTPLLDIDLNPLLLGLNLTPPLVLKHL